MSLPLTPSPPNETSTLLRCSFLAYTSPHTARGDSVEAGAEKPTGLCAAASYKYKQERLREGSPVLVLLRGELYAGRGASRASGPTPHAC